MAWNPQVEAFRADDVHAVSQHGRGIAAAVEQHRRDLTAGTGGVIGREVAGIAERLVEGRAGG